MAVESSSVVVHSHSPQPSSPPLVPEGEPGFEERWAAWRARGRHDDITMRRRMRIAAMAAAFIVAIIAAALALTEGGS